ncbi:MAG: hypothetical protein Q7S00_00040 [bacterium]|nr:hypothetical protein [bacterium]
MKRLLFLTCSLFFFSAGVGAAERCPGEFDPPPPNRPADIPRVVYTLGQLENQKGEKFWTTTPIVAKQFLGLFEAKPLKTKLEQFFGLLYIIQENLSRDQIPLEVTPPRIQEVLLAAKVFPNDHFPKKIKKVSLSVPDSRKRPVFQVFFEATEVRFVLNEGRGFAVWDTGKCQVAKELVFYNGFSFRLKKGGRSGDLIVYDFDKVQLYGDFGSRRLVNIDLNYVDLEQVRFIDGTDEGKVTVRVAKREFEENEHSSLFRYIGTLIPNTSRQRIDW